MISLAQIKSKLPLDFIENLYKTYNTRIADKILLGMGERRFTTLRVNTLKSNVEEVKECLEKQNIEFEIVLWYKDAIIIKNAQESDLQKMDLYKDGKIYLQSLSSMIPPLVLNPKEGEKVLDLTAAPGSKTTQMVALMKNEGYILANELDKLRCERLKYNVNMQGAKIVETINENGSTIGDKYPEYFDKVLLDTPCSGEGRFIANDVKTYKNWSTKQVEELIKVQKDLFTSAVKALKINGEMVYSTCTLNLKENEEIVNWAIKEYPLELEQIKIDLKNTIKGVMKGLDSSLSKSIKMIPTKNQEGFYIAKLRKR